MPYPTAMAHPHYTYLQTGSKKSSSSNHTTQYNLGTNGEITISLSIDTNTAPGSIQVVDAMS